MDSLDSCFTQSATHYTQQNTVGDFDTACQSPLGDLLIKLPTLIYSALLFTHTYLLLSRCPSKVTSDSSLFPSPNKRIAKRGFRAKLSSTKPTSTCDPTCKQVATVNQEYQAHAPINKRRPQESSKRPPSPHAFTSLCDRLLLTNKIWEQEKELKALKSAIASKDDSIARITFTAFADRLLLNNRIWQQDRQILELRASCEKLKKTQESMITRTAEKMMVDVRKEGLVEDFVKDLITELEEAKREISALRESHEREIAEVNSEWLKDYRQLVREVDGLKLGQQARVVEQQLSSEVEDSLVDSLKVTQRKAEILEEKVHVYESSIASLSDMSLTSLCPPASFTFPSCQSLPLSDMSMASVCDPRTPLRRMSFEFDDDDTLADFSIASSSATTKNDISDDLSATQILPVGMKLLRKLCPHDHDTRSPSHVYLPNSKSIEGSLFPDTTTTSSSSSSSAVSRIPGAYHYNRVFFAPSTTSNNSDVFKSSTAARRNGVNVGRSKRPALIPLKLSMSMWPQRRKDHRSPTSASARKALSPASRSRKRVKLAIWRP